MFAVTPPVLWFSGRPGSGKTTIAEAVVSALRTRRVPVEYLSGDELNAQLGVAHDPEVTERRLHWAVNLLTRHDVVVIVEAGPSDGPLAERARAACPGLIEVFVDTPLETCVARVGSHAAEGFTPPVNPDLRVVTHDREPSASAAQVLSLVDTIDLTSDALDGGRPWASAGA